MKTIKDEADYYIQDADARMRSYKPEDLPTFTEQLRGAFIAGANKVRERLIAHYEVEIKAYQKAVKEGLEREKIAKDVIAEKRKEIARLTKWNDPKEEMPEYYKAVEIKYRRSGLSRISIAWFSAGDVGGYLWTIDGTNVLVNDKNVIGWREIPE